MLLIFICFAQIKLSIACIAPLFQENEVCLYEPPVHCLLQLSALPVTCLFWQRLHFFLQASFFQHFTFVCLYELDFISSFRNLEIFI